MEHRPLFRDGPPVSVIGLGTWPIGGGMGATDKASAIDTVRYAIDQGVTFLDTAQGYLESESILGEALRDGYRDRCFLATKVTRDFSAAAIKAALENSLKQIKVDYVDLYQIHWWDDRYPIEETMTALEQLRQEGKTRYTGVSNYTAAQMQTALSIAPFHTNQLEYHLFARDIEAAEIDFCQTHGIGILAHSVLAKGLLTGKYAPDHRFDEADERSTFAQFRNPSLSRYLAVAEQLSAIADELDLSMVQLSIAWVLQQPAVCTALIGAKTPQQLQACLGAVGVTLSDDVKQRIDTTLQDLEGVVPFQVFF